MSMMLSLIDAGWEMVRTAATQGRKSDALTQVTQLLSRPDLPPSLAADAHRLAGELSTEAERYSVARRHLRTALALEPQSAHTFYLLGIALERDPQGCDRRAAMRFQRATKLEPENCLYRAAYGRSAVRCGRTRTGARVLLDVAGKSLSNLVVLRIAIDGLVEAGAINSAQRILTQARFLRPHDRELMLLWERTRFESARREQREQGGTTRHRQDAEHARDGGRVVLPFIRLVTTDYANVNAEPGFRRDVVSFPQPHFPRLSVQGR